MKLALPAGTTYETIFQFATEVKSIFELQNCVQVNTNCLGKV